MDTQELIKKLIKDYNGGDSLPDGDFYPIIYNLFRGNYEFSYSQFEEILEHFIGKRVVKCPICQNNMTSFVATHYHCSECKHYYTN